MKKFLRQNINCIFIMLGSSCNFQCKYCLQHPLITEEVTSKINSDTIDFLKETAQSQKSPLRILFYGGEPLLYWNNIVSITKALQDCNCTFSIISNGSLLTRDKVEFLNNYKINVTISWDGINVKETRGQNIFKNSTLKECIFNLNNVCISAVLSSYNYPLSIVEQVDKLNKEYIKYRKANKLLPASLNINMDEIMDTGLEAKYLTELDCSRISKEMKIMCEHYKNYQSNKEFNPFYVKFISRYVRNKMNRDIRFSVCKCGNGYNVLNLDLDGNLYRCHNTHTKLGNIYDGYFSYLKNVISYDDTKSFNLDCKNCYVQSICKNGCPLITKEVRKRYYCEMKRATLYPIVEMIMEHPFK
ncbi:uncharacterized protein Ga0466249_001519 [Sporomusaceae bacterium BoRhaA]|uniref:radical SAM/SPASM domain-containing protein n=1 Tax=Pelorhabdus rhamnosifermentans TaxID=2772457 RepID=UPI001C064567|nr:radical SAM protein [Pelorhabdus rhamnosifermentans]MBU2700427.1 uncharacterized protein [Pelorhabdus rhamnosifermentans]